MNLEEFEKFVEKGNIEWSEDDKFFYFKDTNLDWYSKEGNFLRVEKDKMKYISVQDLENELQAGLKVEHISRVTGYFAKVSSWNPGKKAELKDRHKANKDSFGE